ncbi:DNA invertase Pin-like site-specific DNA recombinase [Jiangella mangrovi]|uniref:DNA invertase Pin-like site-specific DNA recombinase n=1 Tax=Jiangella mangrovi TaxID=1524084 RepID=A0A7W9LJC7_9ACTN|nr:recombinase family protein [Jiangella mangrovi]MBB5785980.1 DNA invertase Pin-like site-specific DNA recombinase [Jiangella mangrovi]
MRISLDANGDGLAIDRQREDCLRIAAERGWDVIQPLFIDKVSASKPTKVRPHYDAMVAAFGRGEFDALVCWDLDRLTRQPRQLEDWIDAATDRDLILVTANGEADLSTDAGRLFARIKASVARAEVERKGARQRRAALQRSEHGRPPLGVRLTGYEIDGTVISSEAVVVREMFEMFAAGESLRGLASQLTEAGVSTRSGRPWNPSTIRTALANPRYAGRTVYQGKETGQRGGWDAIVDDDLFDIVQTRLSDPRRRTQVGTDRKHLGAGLYRCQCGQRVVSWSGDRYRCSRGCLTRAQGPIDDYVLRVIRERLRRPDLAQLLVSPKDDAEAERLGKEATTLRRRIAKTDEDYDADLIDARRHRVKVEKLRADLDDVNARRARLTRAAGPAAAVLTAPDPAAAFDALTSLMIRRAVVDLFAEFTLHPAPRGRRTFDPESVSIEWRRP